MKNVRMNKNKNPRLLPSTKKNVLWLKEADRLALANALQNK
jgi:hypothetical protein